MAAARTTPALARSLLVVAGVSAFAALVSVAPRAAAKLPLPSYIKSCNASAPQEELMRCSTKHAQEAFTHILNGDRKYKVPDLNPLLIDRLLVDDGQGPLGLNLVATKAMVTGFEDIKINRVEFDMENRHVWYDAYLPAMRLISKYNISGRILLLPITGYGDANLTLQDFYMSYEYFFELERRKDGQVYFVPKPHSDFRFNCSRLHVHLDNLFNGDKLLGDSTNRFMNENWEEMLVSLGPIFTTAISEIVHNILTNIFELVPFTTAFTGTDKYLPP